MAMARMITRRWAGSLQSCDLDEMPVGCMFCISFVSRGCYIYL